MALSIGVSVGSRIDVDGHSVVVKTLSQPNLIVVSVDNGPDVVISDQAGTEILPTVFVFSGVGANGGTNRLAFEAPRAIRISRVEGERDAALR